MFKNLSAIIPAFVISGVLYAIASDHVKELPDWVFTSSGKILVFMAVVGLIRIALAPKQTQPASQDAAVSQPPSQGSFARNIFSPVLAFLTGTVLNSAVAGHAIQAPDWVMTFPSRLLIFVILTGVIYAIWGFKWTGHRATGATPKPDHKEAAKRMEFDRDVRTAFGSRMKITGEHLNKTAVALNNRNLPDLALKAKKIKDQSRLIGDRMSHQPCGPDPSGAKVKLTASRTGDIVEFDKKLLALAEENNDHAIELAGIAKDASLQVINGTLDALDETCSHLSVLLQEREEMIRGIR
jgi:hypothetical protein